VYPCWAKQCMSAPSDGAGQIGSDSGQAAAQKRSFCRRLPRLL